MAGEVMRKLLIVMSLVLLVALPSCFAELSTVFSNGFEDSSSIGHYGFNTSVWYVEYGKDNASAAIYSYNHTGSYSAGMKDGNAGNVSISIKQGYLNLTGYERCELSFWWVSSQNWDSGDHFYVDVYDGSWHYKFYDVTQEVVFKNLCVGYAGCENNQSKVNICHFPGPGTKPNTLCIGKSALDSHTGHHSDYCGPCLPNVSEWKQTTLDVSPYQMIDGFRVRFNQQASNDNEQSWIDDINISCCSKVRVVDVSAQPQNVNQGQTVSISSKVTALGTIDSVKARVSYPNSSLVKDYVMTWTPGNIYVYNFTNTTAVGRYNVTIIANNSCSYVNDSGKTYFVVTYFVPVAAVKPILECVDVLQNGSYVAHFGYQNDNNVTVNIPISGVSPFNKITGGGLAGINQGQPITFLPGRTPYYPNNSFNVIFDGTNLVWTLTGPDNATRTATASNSSTKCDGTPPTILTYNILPRTIYVNETSNAQATVVDNIGVKRVWLVFSGPDTETVELYRQPGDIFKGVFDPLIDGIFHVVVYAEDLAGNIISADAGQVVVNAIPIPPGYTNCMNITSFGLVTQPAIIGVDKVRSFLVTDYFCARTILGLWEYDFYLEINDLNGNPVLLDGMPITYGKYPPSGATVDVYVINRLALWKNEIGVYNPVILSLGVWR
jgi:hypothetical protein